MPWKWFCLDKCFRWRGLWRGWQCPRGTQEDQVRNLTAPMQQKLQDGQPPRRQGPQNQIMETKECSWDLPEPIISEYHGQFPQKVSRVKDIWESDLLIMPSHSQEHRIPAYYNLPWTWPLLSKVNVLLLSLLFSSSVDWVGLAISVVIWMLCTLKN